ncbi:uncharacterized protein LOC100183535 isoform X1 [Ciona intestinalis]
MEEKIDYSTYELGSQEMRATFRLSDAYVMLNHGAYGLSPQPVVEKRIQLIKEQESHPDTWFRINMMDYYMESVKTAAKLINGDVEDTFILNNVTEGTNCILKSILKDSEEILINTHSYKAVQNTLSEMETTFGTKTRCVEICFPIFDEQDVVDLYVRQLDQYPNIKIAVIDHITSPTALKLPVEKIVEVCRERNVLTLIDGAHAPGQLDLDMNRIKADFYVGNLHKWYYTFRGCALLWVSPKHRNKILPLVTSNYSNFTMHHRFCYWGTRDTSPQFTAASASKFYEDIGGLETITGYNNKLVTWAQSMLCEALKTRPLDIPESMKAPNMAVLYLPKSSKKQIGSDELIVYFIEKYNGITVGFTTIDGEVALRLSANVYNCKDDYYKLRDALLDYFNE